MVSDLPEYKNTLTKMSVSEIHKFVIFTEHNFYIRQSSFKREEKTGRRSVINVGTDLSSN